MTELREFLEEIESLSDLPVECRKWWLVEGYDDERRIRTKS